MVYRFSWLAGIAAIGLAFAELSSLIRNSEAGTPWQTVILVAVLLGAGITWTATAYRGSAWLIAAANVGAFAIFAGFVVAPDTLFVVLPTHETWIVLQHEIGRSIQVIQHGVEPVRPVPGLIVLLSLLFWTLGFLITAGLFNNRPFVAVITPLVVTAQFSVIDRTPESVLSLSVFLAIVAFAFIAVSADERDHGAGQMQRVHAQLPPSKIPAPSIGVLVATTVIAGVVAVTVVGESVPADGYVTWRAPSGHADGYSGSVAFNPFTDIRAGLINPTDTPMFTATISGADPAQVRFRTVTLDVYREGRWATARIHSFPLDDDRWVDERHRYLGETLPIIVDIEIQNLAQPWMPAPSTPSATVAPSQEDTDSIEVRRLDGSLFLPEDVTYPGMQYTVLADHPVLTPSDLAAITRTENGELSPLFQAASNAGRQIPAVSNISAPRELSDVEFWTETPDDLGARVRLTALEVTEHLETNFEKALALEDYFRRSGDFVYEIRVPPEFATDSVEDWLTDEDNPYARHGYCEQFATTMALMGRTLGIPTRVVLGFTAGTPLNSTTVQVLNKNAHAWVEMWIPQFGWMAFDPTPRAGYAAATADENVEAILGFSALAYAPDISSTGEIGLDDEIIGPEGPLTPREPTERTVVLGAGGGEDDEAGIAFPLWARWMSGIVLTFTLLASIAPVSKGLRSKRRLRALRQGNITAGWRDITDALVDLGEPIDAADTPTEAVAAIDDALLPLAQSFSDSMYGDYESTPLVVERATAAHTQAVQHIAMRYSRSERFTALLRPAWIANHWNGLIRPSRGSRDQPRAS